MCSLSNHYGPCTMEYTFLLPWLLCVYMYHWLSSLTPVLWSCVVTPEFHWAVHKICQCSLLFIQHQTGVSFSSHELIKKSIYFCLSIIIIGGITNIWCLSSSWQHLMVCNHMKCVQLWPLYSIPECLKSSYSGKRDINCAFLSCDKNSECLFIYY